MKGDRTFSRVMTVAVILVAMTRTIFPAIKMDQTNVMLWLSVPMVWMLVPAVSTWVGKHWGTLAGGEVTSPYFGFKWKSVSEPKSAASTTIETRTPQERQSEFNPLLECVSRLIAVRATEASDRAKAVATIMQQLRRVVAGTSPSRLLAYLEDEPVERRVVFYSAMIESPDQNLVLALAHWLNDHERDAFGRCWCIFAIERGIAASSEALDPAIRPILEECLAVHRSDIEGARRLTNLIARL